jgi:tetratricopeptide (TPR) repeat protein
LAETTALYDAIREQRAQPVVPQPPPEPTTRTQSTFTFVGRAEEMTALLHGWARVGPDGMVLALEGEAGVGKTRLAEEFLATVRLRGGATLSARCYEGEASMSYVPIVEALRRAGVGAWSASATPEARLELSRLLPELAPGDGATSPPPLDSPGAQARFCAALTAALVDATRGAAPGAMFIDDLQWADAATIDLLRYVIHRLPDRAVALVLAWRDDEPAPARRLRDMLADAQHAGRGALLTVQRLPLTAATDLARATLGAEPAARLAERLHQESDGLPLFLTEYLAAIVANGAGGERDWVEPPGVSNLLNRRLAHVSETARQLLATAAVVGRSFDFETLHVVSGRGEDEAVSALEELLSARLVVQLPVNGSLASAHEAYDFAHARLRSLVYDATSLARRRLLHRRVAEYLSRGSSGSPAQIAHHYRQAGQDALAAEHFRAAGDNARELYANADALEHYRAALALAPDPQSAAELHEAIGDLQTLLGDYGAALGSFREVAARAPAERLPGLEHTLARLYHRRGEWSLAESHYRAALADEHGLAPGRRARVLADWSLTVHHAGMHDDALRLGARALEMAEAAHDPAALAQTHNLLGVLARGRGDLDAAARHLEDSLALAEALDDPPARVAALNNLALVCFARAEATRAIELVRVALDVCAQLGDRHREAALHNNLADFLHFSGQPEAAMVHLEQAVTIFAEIGDSLDAEELQPEIWKLSEW